MYSQLSESSQSLLTSYGLVATNVCWEDTARTKGSCYGPNISDMTLCSNNKLCKVIRRPNFADITVDHSLDNFMVTIGNEDGTELSRISLRDYLNKLSIEVDSDEKILCSTQACILQDNLDNLTRFERVKIAMGDLKKKDIPFNVRLFNYQTTSENPAVLVIISTNQGTSAQILDGKTTDILFNKNGKAHDFIAERLKDERTRLGKSTSEPMSMDEKERNVIYVYQVPLVVEKKNHMYGLYSKGFSLESDDSNISSCNYAELHSGGSKRYYAELHSGGSKISSIGFDNAMLRVSSTDKGDFTGTRGKTLKRDKHYPIRCTLQYYWITDDMNLTEPLVKTMSSQLEKFYSNSENKSSLVVGQTNRPTEPKILVDLPNPQFSQQMNTNAF
jgi:hypothetical protein